VSGLPARGDAPDPAALPGLKQPAPVRVIERVKPAPADYAGLEVRIEGVVERDSLTLVTLFCPQMGRTDQLSFSWGSRRASKVAVVPLIAMSRMPAASICFMELPS